MTSTFTVFLLRHGERLDEALARRQVPFPKSLKADPPLTTDGYGQAMGSLRRLLEALEANGTSRKIAVFSSPMKRTIGTSVMLAAAARLPEKSCLEFGLKESIHKTHDVIPIVVMNGLGSCAAFCRKHGGADVLAHGSHIRCGDMAANDGTMTSPFVKELQGMQEEYANEPFLDASTPTTKVQYCKLHGGSGHLVPLASPVSARTVLVSAADNNHGQRQPRVFSQACRQFEREGFRKCIDRAVRIAKEDGCNTLIVVTHREGIYSLVKRWGLNGQEYRGHPYCCIGAFSAYLKDGEERCHWAFQGVTPYELFDKNRIPLEQPRLSTKQTKSKQN